LARWVNRQRSRYNKNELEAERIQQLESVPGWRWNLFEESWERNYKLLQEFHSEFRHLRVPRNPKHYRGFGLASWVQSQRTNYKKGKLDQQSIKRLESLQGWTWNPHDALWENSFAALEQYSLEHNSASPSRTYISDDIKLGVWVGSQRQKYKLGVLEAEQIKRLESLDGWTWQQKSSPSR
jgi:hypothetical protein